MQKSALINCCLWVSRIIFGIVFIFSGFVKAIDPLGFAYKIQEYFLAFDLYWLSDVSLPMAVIMSAVEFIVGVTILIGVKMNFSAWVALLFMVFFTPFTLYVAVFSPVTHCGCFGDALVIGNWGTFIKNVFILAAAILIFIYRKRFTKLWSKTVELFILGFLSVLIVGLSIYGLRNLPVIDFLPWRVGNNITELMEPTHEVADVYLIYRNKETGEEREYSPADLPWDDPVWMQTWEFVDQRKVVIQEAQDAPINNFFINDEYDVDFTEVYIISPGYLFIVVAHDLYKSPQRAFTNSINYLAERAISDNIPIIVLTASGFSSINTFRHNVQAAYPFYQSDKTALKTIIRSNPGLILLKDGVVVGKWHWRNIPDYDRLTEKYIQK